MRRSWLHSLGDNLENSVGCSLNRLVWKAHACGVCYKYCAILSEKSMCSTGLGKSGITLYSSSSGVKSNFPGCLLGANLAELVATAGQNAGFFTSSRNFVSGLGGGRGGSEVGSSFLSSSRFSSLFWDSSNSRDSRRDLKLLSRLVRAFSA